jgi:hypothetical protein
MALKTSFWINPVRMVMKICVPNRMMMRGQPHRKSETAVTAFASMEDPPFVKIRFA